MQKGLLLAEGRTAEVFAWGEDQVLKLYRPEFPLTDAEYEYHKALASQETGFAVPAVGELVTVDGRAGITYQRVEGNTMLEATKKAPWKLFPFTRQLAALHVDMHERSASNLPSAHEVIAHKINYAPTLDQRTKTTITEYLWQLPQDDKLLHGDFHPDNILLTPDGPVIIDWIDATMGHPLADVARTSLLARVASPPPMTALEAMISLLSGLFHRTYIKHYFKSSPYEENDLLPWLLPVTAGRLSEEIAHETRTLVELVENMLGEI
jgi:aminoglycoside phosphotransferase (APT) family kinase protein